MSAVRLVHEGCTGECSACEPCLLGDCGSCQGRVRVVRKYTHGEVLARCMCDHRTIPEPDSPASDERTGDDD